MSEDKPDTKELEDAVKKPPAHVRHDIPPFPFEGDATFMAYLPTPKAKTGGPIIRQFRTLGIIKASDGSTRYRFPRGRWPVLSTKVDSEGKQLFRFDRDPQAITVDEVQERQFEVKRKKQAEIAKQKAINEQAEREDAERKARIDAEARVKVEMEMKEKEKEKEKEKKKQKEKVAAADADSEDDGLLGDDFDFEDDEAVEVPKKVPAKKAPAKKKTAAKKSSSS